jgi:YesN/AraC family two-component response regulator
MLNFSNCRPGVINKINKINVQGKGEKYFQIAIKRNSRLRIDTNMSLSLQQAPDELEINPAYLSRGFSKYFDNLSFGDYIRKMTIEKAMLLIEITSYSLTEIACLAGFSDQSHFNRIFKKQTGENPTVFRKNIQKGKKNTNS